MKLDNQSKIRLFSRWDTKDRFAYLFIDESGNSSKKMWSKIDPCINKKGHVSRDISCYTMTGILVKSKKEYGRITKRVQTLKIDIFGKEYKNTHFHRNKLFSRSKNNPDSVFNNINAYRYEKGLIKIACEFKLPIFSASLNREIYFLKEKNFKNPSSINKNLDLKKLLFEKIMNYTRNYCYNNNFKKKIVIVMETEDTHHDNQILNYFESNKTSNFKKFLFMKKTIVNKKNQTERSLVMNEMVDFINATFFVWAANTPYHLLKFNMPEYPKHFKHSLTIIDANFIELKHNNKTTEKSMMVE